MLLSPKRIMQRTLLPREKKVAIMLDCEALSISLPDQLFLSLVALPSLRVDAML